MLLQMKTVVEQETMYIDNDNNIFATALVFYLN